MFQQFLHSFCVSDLFAEVPDFLGCQPDTFLVNRPTFYCCVGPHSPSVSVATFLRSVHRVSGARLARQASTCTTFSLFLQNRHMSVSDALIR